MRRTYERYIAPDAKDAVAGDIFWLKKQTPSGDLEVSVPSTDDGIYDHPVVILSIDIVKGKASVLVLSSLKGRNIEDYSNNHSIRTFHLPIYPSPAHPDSGVLLYLHDNAELDKKTNLKLEKVYSVPLSSINFGIYNRTSRERFKLRRDSFKIVLRAIKYERKNQSWDEVDDTSSPPSISSHMDLHTSVPPRRFVEISDASWLPIQSPVRANLERNSTRTARPDAVYPQYSQHYNTSTYPADLERPIIRSRPIDNARSGPRDNVCPEDSGSPNIPSWNTIVYCCGIFGFLAFTTYRRCAKT